MLPLRVPVLFICMSFLGMKKGLPMSTVQASHREGAHLLAELLSVHGVMIRGAEAVAGAFTRLAEGAAVDMKVLAATARWLVAFVHHHRQSAGELLWPVLRDKFPDSSPRLDALIKEHETLGMELEALTQAVDRLAEERRIGGSSDWGLAMKQGTRSSHRIRDVLASQLAAEELVLKKLLPAITGDDVLKLREAVAEGAPHNGRHLVFGFLEHPEPMSGRERLYAHFPARARWSRGLLMMNFRKTMKALALKA